jgi:hypothetical protein
MVTRYSRRKRTTRSRSCFIRRNAGGAALSDQAGRLRAAERGKDDAETTGTGDPEVKDPDQKSEEASEDSFPASDPPAW